MAEKFYSILTNIGKAKVANSIGLGTKINFAKMKVGDGGGSYYEPTESQTDLKNVVWEGNINHVTVDEKNPNWIHIEVMIPSTVGGFTIREYGAYDNEGDLIGICKCAETYKPVIADGSTKELLLDLILCVVNTDTVELKIDPTIIFAKKSEVEQLRTDIEAQMKDIANDSYPIVEATGTNNYVGASARIKSVGKGTRCTVIVGTASTGNCSLNINSEGPVAIKDSNGNVVTNMKANIPYNLFHNGTDFILQGKGGGGNLIPKYLLTGYYGDGDNGRVDGAMVNRGAPISSINCGSEVDLLEGYYSGGKVTANSLASQTPGNATTEQILAGFSAWVNGNKINGRATIENLGGTNKKSGTLTMNPRTTINIKLGFKPNFILVKCSYLDSSCFLYITNDNFAWIYPGTYWICGSGPSNNDLAMKYSEDTRYYFSIIPDNTGFNLSYNASSNTTVSYVACIL